MDGQGSQPKLENENESPVESKKELAADRKSLSSQSSASECDEWVLVNALGNDVENSSCRARHDVGTEASFVAPVMKNAAAASLSIELKPSADVYCSAVAKAEVVDTEPEKEIKPECEAPAAVEVTSAISLVAPVQTSDISDLGVMTEFSRAEEKTIKRAESSEDSSQISLLDHNDDALSSLEGGPSSMASSVASTDIGGYEMVSSLHSRADQTEERHEEDDSTLPALDDALPVNFVQACSTRIRNYIHAYDLALNWKLSLLVVVASAAVLGLGLGHFIGSTHMWLSRQSINHQQEEDLRTLEIRLIGCLNRLHQAEGELESEATSSGCQGGYCQADEKPACPAHGDFGSRLAGCLERLQTCRDRLNAVEEHKKRSEDMVKAFRDLRLLRQNLMRVHATYEKLGALAKAERNHLRKKDDVSSIDAPDSKPLVNEKEMEELSKKLKEAESREDKLIRQEIELRRMLANLESTVEALNAELAKMKSQTGERKEQGSEKRKEADGGDAEEPTLEEDEEAADSDFNWNRLSDLFEQLKDTSKFSQVFETYFDIFKDLKLPEINISKLWLDQLPSSLEEMATNLKQGLDEKVRELEERLYATDWDQYVQKAKDVTSRVGETVGTLWKKAKDLSDHVREQHGEQGEKIFNEIKATVEKAAEVFDKRWEQAARFWRDVVGTRDEEEETEEGSGPLDAEEEDDGKDQVWIYHESNDEEQADETTLESEGGLGDENEVEGERGSVRRKAEGVDEEKRMEKVGAEKYRGGADAANEVKQLRETLKSSSVFSRYVTDEFADHYFRRLKQAGRSLAQEANDHSAWWLCQKLWWTRHSFAYGRQCSNKLMTWQRHVRVDVDVRQKLIDETPRLKSLIKRFASEETPMPKDEANWVFEWAKNRQEMRRDDERRKNKKSWMDERWQSRDQMRHQKDSPSPASQWLLRRAKEREKTRGEEQQGQRRSRTMAGGKGSSKQQQDSFNSQRRRR